MNFGGFDLNKFERHTNTYIHDIINLLKKKGTLTFEEIHKETNINLLNNFNLVKSLRNNQRIIFQDNSLSYKHSYLINSREDLENVMRGVCNKEGIELNSLRDSPVDIMPLVEELKDSLVILKDNDNSEVVFYNDMLVEKVDEDVKDLWRSIKVPVYQDLIRQLNTAGLKKDKVEYTKKKIIQKKDKSKRYKRRIKITNTHVKGLDLSGME
ncbi:General transcription factor IIE subunit 2 [Nosema granulosis]|uniref:General transcription factor IIE subunit 2 n=1 Tax=Nosema granulosis TaxID=83296 RepID=A0A9P6GZR7_9MICR|nr:General transcription factor IIE subunit 2 [Nosema granulosis]